MKTFRLALRNILRNKRRTLITFMAIISGLTGIIVFGGFVDYAIFSLYKLTVYMQLGHIQIYKKGYTEKGIADPSKYLMNNTESIEKAIGEIPGVVLVTNRITFSGLISTGEKTLICKGIGIDVAKEDEMITSKGFDITMVKDGKVSKFESIVEGEPLRPDMTDSGLIGAELMKALGANIGDYLTLLTTTVDGTINAIDFRLAGVAQTGSQEMDSVFVKLPLQLVQDLLNTTSVERTIVLLENNKELQRVAADINHIIEKNGGDLEVKLWTDLADFYHKVVALYNGMFGVIRVIIAVIVLFSIANTMTMSIFERIREIGTLRAIGTTQQGIVKLFLSEGILIGIVGGFLGILFGVGVAYTINIAGGIYIPPPPALTFGYMTKILVVPKVVFYGFLLIVLVSVLSSVYPAYKASKLKVIEALHHT